MLQCVWRNATPSATNLAERREIVLHFKIRINIEDVYFCTWTQSTLLPYPSTVSRYQVGNHVLAFLSVPWLIWDLCLFLCTRTELSHQGEWATQNARHEALRLKNVGHIRNNLNMGFLSFSSQIICRYWWHRRLSLWQPLVQTMMAKLTSWRLSVFGMYITYALLYIAISWKLNLLIYLFENYRMN